ncbi:MAG: adenylate/guanylate cyclase domain-containing protein [Saprospiraceae bacterium]
MLPDFFVIRRLWALAASLALSLALGAQSAAELERKLKSAASKEERLTLSYELAQKYMSGNPKKAAEYADQASRLATELNDRRRETDATLLSGEAFYRARDYKNASARYLSAWNSARNYGLREPALSAIEKLQDIANKQNDLKEALKWSNEAIAYLKESGGGGRSGGDAQRRLENRLAALEAENRTLREQIKDLSGRSQSLESTYKQTEAALREVQEKTRAEVDIREQKLSQISQEKQRTDSLFKARERLMENLSKEQMANQLLIAQRNEEVERQKLQLAEAELRQKESENLRNVLGLVAGVVLLLALLIYIRFVSQRRMAKQLARTNAQIESEKERSNRLLLNILPPAIAEELKAYNKVKARKYEQATVMFIDFTGFTKVAERLSPETLVEELDYCFRGFDQIIEHYRIEKIKTIGDAYLCASGLSDRNDNPSDMIKAALAIQDFMLHTQAVRMDQGLPFFEARVGIHTGPVVAGVVGVKKFAYDIWGDTVNVAARMEETCDPGKVNVSEDTYALAKYDFEWEYRGRIAPKNKAAMDMYYVVGIKKY